LRNSAARTWYRRLTGVAVLLAMFWFVPWMAISLNAYHMWMAVPFLIGNLIIAFSVMLMVVNNWERRPPKTQTVAPGREPVVGILIPTAGEPVAMVVRTIRSVLDQDWPRDRLGIVVSDDGGNPQLENAVSRLRARIDGVWIQYHRPSPRSSRRGEAKAGNLNSAAAFFRQMPRGRRVEFIETRDADDEVGDPRFLRLVIGQLLADDRLAFVQTIKDARVSPGDPFNNREPIFYREIMLAKNAANAVFPCGSGVVWRTDALEDVGYFPTWNLVEDLHSGVEALRRGWRGAYLPIIGAIAQVAPHDIPNVYKQRGTWALDTTRLLLYGDLRGLSLRQYAHFLEMGVYYLQGAATSVLAFVGVAWLLFDLHPVAAEPLDWAVHFIPYMLATELYFIAFSRPQPYSSWWRMREMTIGLAPVFAMAFIQAAVDGRAQKPTYRVTRKQHEFSWYWRETLPQAAVVALLSGGLLYTAVVREAEMLSLGGLYYIVLLIIFGTAFVRKAWFGVPGGPLGYIMRIHRPHPSRAEPATGSMQPAHGRHDRP
jgi:cellulose synthase (UDP-forming)